jgi:hypothetical protein
MCPSALYAALVHAPSCSTPPKACERGQRARGRRGSRQAGSILPASGYLTEREIERLIAAAGKNRWGYRTRPGS